MRRLFAFLEAAPLTAEEYRRYYAREWEMPVPTQHSLGLTPVPCWCNGWRPGCCGWQMVESEEVPLWGASR